VEEHISQKSSNSKRDKIEDYSFFQSRRTKEDDVKDVNEEDWNYGYE